METEHKHSMEQFDWIGKSIIGAIGTWFSVFFIYFNEILSAIAAILTIAYMIRQHRGIGKKEKRAEELHRQRLNDPNN